MNFRLYQPRDFARLYAIETACFQSPLRFSRVYMRQLVASIHTATWVADLQGELAGFAIAEWLRNAQGVVAYIETLEVAVAHRRQGIAAELLRRVEGSARIAGAHTMWLHVDVQNATAIRLYEGSGYICQDREEHYYDYNRPALVYAKPISAPAAAPRAICCPSSSE